MQKKFTISPNLCHYKRSLVTLQRDNGESDNLFQQVEIDIVVVVSSHEDLGVDLQQFKKITYVLIFSFSDNSAIWDRLPLESAVYWRHQCEQLPQN